MKKAGKPSRRRPTEHYPVTRGSAGPTALWKEALEGQLSSYSPYSKFAVGAALETKAGRVYRGSNVENASYGGTICAERVAFLKAASEGAREFRRIVVVVKAPAVAAPCALCLQTMAEFCASDFEIWIGNTKGLTKGYLFSELLPVSFGPKDLL